MFTAHCQHCSQESRPWARRQDAEDDVVWHVYLSHPDVWYALIGDRVPAAHDPQLVAMN